MLGVFVTFRYIGAFDPARVQQIAEAAQAKFQGMAGLRSKAFTINQSRQEAVNFYVWDSEEAARAFFSEELRARIAALYGTSPSVEFVQIAALVNNTAA